MRTRIVIVGGGFGGLEAAFTLTSLMGSSASIILVDQNAYHAFIPSIHEIVSCKTTPRAIQVSLQTVLGTAGVRFVQDKVVSVDVQRHEITGRRDHLSYDYLILSVGAGNNFFGVPGARTHSYPFRTPDDAEHIRVNLERNLLDYSRAVRILLAGGGTEGVELAGEIIDFIHEYGYGDDLIGGRIVVELIEGRDRLLPGFPAKAQEIAADYLTKLDIRITAGSRIAEVRPDRLLLVSGEERPFSLLIWTGGIKPAEVLDRLSLPKDASGWLLVDRNLRSPEEETVYGVGDAVAVQGEEGPLRVQRLAYHAQDQAIVAGMNIGASIRGGLLTEYTPRTKPLLVSMGKNNGLFVLDDRVFFGRWVIGLKKAVERKHLMICLTRPLTSRYASLVPGMSLLSKMKLRLPL